MSKKSKKINFTKPPQWTPPEIGLTITEELKQLLAQPGYLSDETSGERASHLYSNQSMNFRMKDFGHFGEACFCGDLRTVQWYLMTGNAPPLSQKVSAYEFGYASLIVTGAQRVAPMPGGSLTPEHLAVLELLISRGLPLSDPDIGGYTALHHCVLGMSEVHNSFGKEIKEKIMRKLLSSGADINYRNRWGDTPLHHAIQRGDILGIDLLMEHGADVDIPGGNGATVRELYIPTGATVAAAMEKWLLMRSGKEKAPMTGKCCDECGATDKPLRSCSGCLTVQYCSRECQRSAWAQHKKKCKVFTTSSSATLVPYYLPAEAGGYLLPQEPLRRGIAGLPTNVPASHLRISQPPTNLPAGGKQVVVKIQIPTPMKYPNGMYQEMLVYTQKRDFACMVRREDCPKAWDRVYDVVKNKSLSGLKGYFIADIKSPGELVVKVSELLAAQPW